MFHKGQIYSIDLVFAFSILTLLLITVIYYQNYFVINIDENEKSSDIHRIANNVAAKLILSPGEPSNWSTLDSSSIGIAKDRNILDENKLTTLLNLLNSSDGYEKGKEALGVFAENSNLEYHITIEGEGLKYTVGKEKNSSIASSSSRYAVLNDKTIKATVVIWERT
ncbi:hypothetical protein HY570_02165 [Candidatus Micrarchaeota archaeon]|nr:hypothetical protein [Candidatus Micrarchaeota archaeon]